MEHKNEIEFADVCESYMPLVKSLVKKWHLHSDPDEFMQLGRIALYEAWCNFDPDHGSFAAYAKSYVHGKIKNELTKQSLLSERYVATEPVVLSEVAPAVTEEERIILEDWIERANLTERERTWLREAVLYDHHPRDIAARLGVDVEKVKGWRKQTLKKLRNAGTHLVHQFDKD
ncbi:sigma-70 family RNA polymerase sigma factor [Texcoconibacillus texcoconensis]|uniref:DNA-directed RNA polymerase n=1 Tax=Texcoconibacillus texcoconensis TaxID=1095777 RepID=A0A840QT76_9BACI|nr:sigma-70 family RNA polymerase sigma factor [Texcoconibacillus texcoconensis]MBB5174550.1 DNA-directed RNA polymerase [Texcoconibacillus texcoconensis]